MEAPSPPLDGGQAGRRARARARYNPSAAVLCFKEAPVKEGQGHLVIFLPQYLTQG